MPEPDRPSDRTGGPRELTGGGQSLERASRCPGPAEPICRTGPDESCDLPRPAIGRAGQCRQWRIAVRTGPGGDRQSGPCPPAAGQDLVSLQCQLEPVSARRSAGRPAQGPGPPEPVQPDRPVPAQQCQRPGFFRCRDDLQPADAAIGKSGCAGAGLGSIPLCRTTGGMERPASRAAARCQRLRQVRAEEFR